MTIRKFEDFANSGEIQSIYIGGTDAATDKVMTSGAIATSEDWIYITEFSNSWIDNNASVFPMRYKKLKNNMVIIEGTVMSGTFGSGDGGLGEAFVLPIGYRPEKTQLFSGRTSTGSALIYLYPSGSLVLTSELGTTGSSDWTVLHGISFLAEA